MNLEEKINSELKSAMLAKDEKALRGLRAIKQAILLAKTSGSATTPEDEIRMLQKLVKQRKESVEIYQQQGRNDLADAELEEISVIEGYLPAQMSEDQIRVELKKILADSGAQSAKDMGKVMGIASRHFAGKADNKVVSQLVRELLGA
ncbi:MAG: GatB/YqeY domain-containing protein [Bacteroidia bacterium]|nr:GatB/YqeY domain-containing protein [Bacteroidia bacterium]